MSYTLPGALRREAWLPGMTRLSARWNSDELSIEYIILMHPILEFANSKNWHMHLLLWADGYTSRVLSLTVSWVPNWQFRLGLTRISSFSSADDERQGDWTIGYTDFKAGSLLQSIREILIKFASLFSPPFWGVGAHVLKAAILLLAASQPL